MMASKSQILVLIRGVFSKGVFGMNFTVEQVILFELRLRHDIADAAYFCYLGIQCLYRVHFLNYNFRHKRQASEIKCWLLIIGN